MGASDYMVGNAPGGVNYAAPLMGMQLGQALAQLPDQYMKGRENNRKIQMEDMFKDGLPTDENGNPDMGKAFQTYMKEGARIGGGDFVKGFVPFMQDQEVANNASRVSQGLPPLPSMFAPRPPQQPNDNSVAAGPGSPPPQAPQQPQAPAGPSIADVVRKSGLQLNPQQIFSLGRVVGINPQAPLNPEQMTKVQSALQQLPTPSRVASSEDNAPAAGPSSAAERGANGPNGANAEASPAGGVDGAPGPTATPAPFMAGKAAASNAGAAPGAPANFNERFTPQSGQPGPQPQSTQPQQDAAGIRQTPVGTEAEARNQLLQAQRKEAAAAYTAKMAPGQSKVYLEEAKGHRERAEKILGSLGEYNKPTGAQIESRDPTVQAQKKQEEQQRADVKYYDTLHHGHTGAGMIAAQQKQNIDILRQVVASPSFTPGAGSDVWLAYQRMAAQAGINPTGAAPRELFNQVSARILADQFSSLKSLASETGETGARIFKPMLDIEEKANITPVDSIEGIKAKLDLIDKMGDIMKKSADMADDYKIKHGSLDAGFEKQLRGEIAKARIPNVVPQKAAPVGPPVGHIEQGHRFKGGNPNDPKSWELAAPAGDRS